MGAASFLNDSEGQSTNLIKLYKKAALMKYSLDCRDSAETFGPQMSIAKMNAMKLALKQRLTIDASIRTKNSLDSQLNHRAAQSLGLSPSPNRTLTIRIGKLS
jgi:hypothetical protein